VRHQNTVFYDLLKRVPWDAFTKLAAAHGVDARVRRLPTKTQFIALLFATLSGASSLRDLVNGLLSHGERLYHLGARRVRRSTLADANAQRSPEVFAGILQLLMQQADSKLRRAIADTTLLIDATSLPLNMRSARWARFSAKLCGAKLHIIYDAAAERPIYAAISAARINDITAAKEMPIVPGATYVFDLGYYDYAWWAELDRLQCRIVTRIKSNTPLQIIERLPLPADSSIISDCIGFLPQRQAKNRRNPLDHAVREVRVRTESGKVLRILCNDLDAAAQEIADLYKQRWQIELFFRWVKQTLKITRFLGVSENAVRIQIAVALIAYLLLRITHAAHRLQLTPTEFARLVRINLMHRRRIDQLLEPTIAPDQHPQQGQLQWNLT